MNTPPCAVDGCRRDARPHRPWQAPDALCIWHLEQWRAYDDEHRCCGECQPAVWHGFLETQEVRV